MEELGETYMPYKWQILIIRQGEEDREESPDTSRRSHARPFRYEGAPFRLGCEGSNGRAGSREVHSLTHRNHKTERQLRRKRRCKRRTAVLKECSRTCGRYKEACLGYNWQEVVSFLESTDFAVSLDPYRDAEARRRP